MKAANLSLFLCYLLKVSEECFPVIRSYAFLSCIPLCSCGETWDGNSTPWQDLRPRIYLRIEKKKSSFSCLTDIWKTVFGSFQSLIFLDLRCVHVYRYVSMHGLEQRGWRGQCPCPVADQGIAVVRDVPPCWVKQLVTPPWRSLWVSHLVLCRGCSANLLLLF